MISYDNKQVLAFTFTSTLYTVGHMQVPLLVRSVQHCVDRFLARDSIYAIARSLLTPVRHTRLVTCQSYLSYDYAVFTEG